MRDALNRLQLSKMISAAYRAQRMLVSGWLNAARGEKLPSIAVPGVVEIAQTVSPSLSFEFPGAELGSPQSDTAANIGSDQRRIYPAFDRECSSDRTAFAGMQIRQTHREPHAWQFGGVLQLLYRCAFNPTVRGREEAHFRRFFILQRVPFF